MLDELTECVPDHLHGVGESDVLVKVLERFLESLSKESRIIFVQRYWFGCSISEIFVDARSSHAPEGARGGG